MTPPEALERALLDRLPGVSRIDAVHPIGGGCIHAAVRLDTDDGPLFCKSSDGDAGRGFGVEARGLDALRTAARGGDIRVPEVRGWHDAEDGGPGWLVLEWLPPSTPSPDFDERWGRSLADLHRPSGDAWGWHEDNTIGSLHQSNSPLPTWAEFWAERRLRAQLRSAVDQRRVDGADRSLFEQAIGACHHLLVTAEHEGPSLLHGDLWAGNVHPGPDGRPVLIDPAVYRGHREVDLAMAALFGGLGTRALDAYRETWPLEPGHDARRPAYQLYYLLVHLNLFGSGYLGSCRRTARAVCAAGSP